MQCWVGRALTSLAQPLTSQQIYAPHPARFQQEPAIMPRLHRAIVSGLVLHATLCSEVAMAQTAPPRDPIQSKTIHLIVAFPPGGGQDLVARVLAPKLGAAMDKTVIVENSTGGAGFVGIMAAVR